ALVVMAYELGRDVVLGRRTRVELAELRGQLAQVERASALGQLASTLAHELSQPLTAILADAETGLSQLKRPKPNLEEVQAILTDIRNDNRRAAAVVTRMRQLFQRRSIDLHPLDVEEVVQDVVSLIRSELVVKQVGLTLNIPDDLSRV